MYGRLPRYSNSSRFTTTRLIIIIQVLVLHLKRFSFRNILWKDKLDFMVDYPTTNLDISDFTSGPKDGDLKYDLYDMQILEIDIVNLVEIDTVLQDIMDQFGEVQLKLESFRISLKNVCS